MNKTEIWFKEQQDKNKVNGVEYDLYKRWEEGIEHHPKSIVLYNRIAKLDFLFYEDSFHWKSGGDGDNGERLLLLLDMAFEEMDTGLVINNERGYW